MGGMAALLRASVATAALWLLAAGPEAHLASSCERCPAADNTRAQCLEHGVDCGGIADERAAEFGDTAAESDCGSCEENHPSKADTAAAWRWCKLDAGKFALPEQLRALAPWSGWATSVCEHVGEAPDAPRLSHSRWTAATERSIGPLVAELELAVAQEPAVLDAKPWRLWIDWVDRVAFGSEQFELRSLSAPVLEAVFFAIHARHGTMGTLLDFTPEPAYAHTKANIPAHALHGYLQAGRRWDAERMFERLWWLEEGTGSFPYRYFFAHHDFHRVSGYPWPGLRKLDWPDPHAMLPPGVGKELLASFTQIRSEVQAAVAADATLLTAEGDAYPSIAG